MAGSDLVFRLIGIDSGATAAVERLGVASSRTAKQLETIGAASTTAGTKVATVADKVGKVSAIAAAGIVGYGVKAASEFGKLTNVYVTAAGESQKNLKTVQDGVLKVATSTGTAWQDVAKAAYTAEKAGYRGADVYKVLEPAAQGAKEENADLATVIDAATSVMASYHLKASDSVSVINQLKTAAGESKVTFEQYAGALSTVLPVASAAGISFADVAGNLATLTQHGTSADEATQELAFAIRNLNAPSQVAQKEMAQLGLNSVDVSSKLGQRGLAGTVNMLSEAVLKQMGPSGTLLLNTFNQSQQAAEDAQRELAAMPPTVQKVAKAYQDGTITYDEYRKQMKALPTDQSNLLRQFKTTTDGAKGFQQAIKNGTAGAQTYSDAMKKMMGGANGLNVALQTSGESASLTAERIKKVNDAAKDNKAVEGWASTLGLSSTQADRFKQTMQALAIQIGQKVLPVLTSVASFLTEHASLLKDATYAVIAFGAAWVGLKIYNTISTIVVGIGRLSLAVTGLIGRMAGATAATEATAAAQTELAVSGSAAARAILTEEAALAGMTGTAGAAGAAAGAGAAGVGRMTAAFAGLKAIGVTALLAGAAYGLEKIKSSSNDTKNRIANDLGLNFGAADFNGMIQNAINKKNNLDLANKVSAASTQLNALAEDRFAQSLQHMNAYLGIGTVALQGNSAAAVSHRQTVLEEVQAVQRHADSVLKQTGSMQRSSAAFQQGIGAIVANAAALGYNKQQVSDLIAKLLQIPPSRTSKVTIDGLTLAQQQLDATIARIDAIKSKTIYIESDIVTRNILISNAQGVASDQRYLNDPRLQASGGYISGPGTATSDSIPARLSNGEFVVNAKSTAAYRPFLEAINSKGFALGGYVGSSVPMVTTSHGSSGGDVHVHVHAWDGASVDRWLTNGGDKKIAIAVARAQKNGLRLN